MNHSITEIEKIYPNWFNPDHEFSYDIQKSIWEDMPLSEEDEVRLKQITDTASKQGVILSGNVNGTCKLKENSGLILSKGEAILQLRKCNYKTAPKIIASYLEIIFSKWPSKEGHWLFIAQHYTPKTINCLITQIMKRSVRGDFSIINLASYFTATLQRHRKMRKVFREIKYRYKSKGGEQ